MSRTILPPTCSSIPAVSCTGPLHLSDEERLILAELNRINPAGAIEIDPRSWPQYQAWPGWTDNFRFSAVDEVEADVPPSDADREWWTLESLDFDPGEGDQGWYDPSAEPEDPGDAQSFDYLAHVEEGGDL